MGVHIYVYLSRFFLLVTLSFVQDFVLAFMMGTHSRLGAGSHVLLLDPNISALIAQSIIPDRW